MLDVRLIAVYSESAKAGRAQTLDRPSGIRTAASGDFLRGHISKPPEKINSYHRVHSRFGVLRCVSSQGGRRKSVTRGTCGNRISGSRERMPQSRETIGQASLSMRLAWKQESAEARPSCGTAQQSGHTRPTRTLMGARDRTVAGSLPGMRQILSPHLCGWGDSEHHSPHA